MSLPASPAGLGPRRTIPIAALAGLALAAGTALAAGSNSPSDPEFARIPLSTGVELHYAEQGDPAEPAVLLLHGYTDSWFSFSRVLPLLPDGHRYLAPDLRGHGRSDRPHGDYSLDALAGDVVAFLDALSIEQATLVGHSMGSFVAQRVASIAPERVEGLVLIGSATRAEAVVGVGEFAAAVAGLEDPVPDEFVREFQVSTVFEPVPAQFLETAVAESLRLPARVWRALLQGMRSAGRFGPSRPVPVPTLLLWGDRDAMMPRSEQDALLAAFPGATLVAYEETGHAPHWERPERVADDLEAFLGRPR